MTKLWLIFMNHLLHFNSFICLLFCLLFISVFRSTPTTDAPYVCNQCNWSFTQQQITYHHQREGVSGRFQNLTVAVQTNHVVPQNWENTVLCVTRSFFFWSISGLYGKILMEFRYLVPLGPKLSATLREKNWAQLLK